MISRKPRTPPNPTAGAGRQRILTGARLHFFTHGFRSVTMADLASELGMSKKTLYLHFTSKTELLEAVVGQKLEQIQADLTGVMDAGKITFSERLRRLLAGMSGHMAEIQPAFMRDLQREAPGLFARIQQGRRKLIHQCFGQLLEEGRKAGAVRTDIPVKLLIEMLVGTVDAIVVPARVAELGITPRTALVQIVSVFLEGVLVRKGGAE